jgi:hypothetical protein
VGGWGEDLLFGSEFPSSLSNPFPFSFLLSNNQSTWCAPGSHVEEDPDICLTWQQKRNWFASDRWTFAFSGVWASCGVFVLTPISYFFSIQFIAALKTLSWNHWLLKNSQWIPGIVYSAFLRNVRF